MTRREMVIVAVVAVAAAVGLALPSPARGILVLPAAIGLPCWAASKVIRRSTTDTVMAVGAGLGYTLGGWTLLSLAVLELGSGNSVGSVVGELAVLTIAPLLLGMAFTRRERPPRYAHSIRSPEDNRNN